MIIWFLTQFLKLILKELNAFKAIAKVLFTILWGSVRKLLWNFPSLFHNPPPLSYCPLSFLLSPPSFYIVFSPLNLSSCFPSLLHDCPPPHTNTIMSTPFNVSSCFSSLLHNYLPPPLSYIVFPPLNFSGCFPSLFYLAPSPHFSIL